MKVNFDRWTFLKLVEVCFTIACLTCKRITDDEASRLFLYLQKISREWSLLTNVTWDQLGSAVADATYGGYVIITSALFIGRLFGELPTPRRITEIVLLLLGAFLFIVIGGLELAALDSLPQDLVDNAAVIGSLSLATAALFILDLAGPRGKKTDVKVIKEVKPRKADVYLIEKPMEISQIPRLDAEKIHIPNGKDKNGTKGGQNGIQKNGHHNGQQKGNQNGYQKMKDAPQKFDIYGKDYDTGSDEDLKDIVEQSPVWSKIRKGQYVMPSFWYPKHGEDTVDRPPSSPGDPGYVQYTAKRWGQQQTKTPRHSPTEV